MAARDQTATVQLKARMREPLRAKLEQAAAARDVSLNTEMVERLERSFSEERGWGGPAIQHMAYLMASSFALAGNRSNPDLPPEQWINDPDCYRAAAVAVVLDLVMNAPNADDPDNIALMFEAVRGRVLSRLINMCIPCGHEFDIYPPSMWERLVRWLFTHTPVKEHPHE